MVSGPGQQIYDILKEYLSETTAGMILKEKCGKISKTPDTIMPEDLKNLVPLILGSVLLFGGEEKAQKVKEGLAELGIT